MNLNRVSLAAFVLLACELFHPTETRGFRACGKDLADLVQMYCSERGGVYTPDYNVRSFRRRRSSMRVSVGGIVGECCLNTCTPRVLGQYCQDPFVVMANDNNIDRIWQKYVKYIKYKKINSIYHKIPTVSTSRKKSFTRKKPIGYNVRSRPIFLS